MVKEDTERFVDMNQLDQYTKVNILSYLDVTKLIQKKAVSSEFRELCDRAILAKINPGGPTKFKKITWLRHYLNMYLTSKRPEDMEYIASTYGYPIGKWDVSQMTSLAGLFVGYAEFKEDLSQWDTSNVRIMTATFRGTERFNSDISGWDTSSVEKMNKMFYKAPSFNCDISGWDTGNVTDMSGMFQFAKKFNQDISGWDVSNVYTMRRMFRGACKFNQNISCWNTSKLAYIQEMFVDATDFNQDLSSWNVSNVHDIRDIRDDDVFDGCNVSFDTVFRFYNAHKLSYNKRLKTQHVTVID